MIALKHVVQAMCYLPVSKVKRDRKLEKDYHERGHTSYTLRVCPQESHKE